MLALLFVGSLSWNEQMLATAAQIGFNTKDDEYSANLLTVLENGGDKFTRPAEAGAWISFIERKPYNIEYYRHWRFHRDPINPEGLEIVNHIDSDTLQTNTQTVLSKLVSGSINRTWAYSLSLKVLLSGLSEIHDPLHVSEYFSSSFRNGDGSGSQFKVKVHGKEMTLYDLWDSGCGAFDSNWKAQESSWSSVDKLAKDLIAAVPIPSPLPKINIAQVRTESKQYAESFVYQGLTPGSEITDSYIQSCKDHSRRKVAEAGALIASALDDIRVISFPPQSTAIEFRSSEAIAWSIFCVIVPITGFIVWKRHFSE